MKNIIFIIAVVALCGCTPTKPQPDEITIIDMVKSDNAEEISAIDSNMKNKIVLDDINILLKDLEVAMDSKRYEVGRDELTAEEKKQVKASISYDERYEALTK